jgi:glycosyltransferase involved in cell wall biosynthesis
MHVSIIIANHNYGRFLGRAIQSCLAQEIFSKSDYEVIVVDDGSTDTSRQVIDSYLPDIKALYHEEQRGLPAAINTGVRASNGMYILRLDSDDWLGHYAAFALSYFLDNNKGYGFVWSDYVVYDDKEQVIDKISEPQGAGIMFRKQLLVDVGLYDEEMLVHEDKDILLRCLAKYSGYHLKLPLYRYYRHGANLTGKMAFAATYQKKLGKKHGKGAWENAFIIDPGAVRQIGAEE